MCEKIFIDSNKHGVDTSTKLSLIGFHVLNLVLLGTKCMYLLHIYELKIHVSICLVARRCSSLTVCKFGFTLNTQLFIYIAI